MYAKLKQYRKSKYVTGEVLSKLLGLQTISAYHKKENGKVPFTLEEAKKISDFFNKKIDYLFFQD